LDRAGSGISSRCAAAGWKRFCEYVKTLRQSPVASLGKSLSGLESRNQRDTVAASDYGLKTSDFRSFSQRCFSHATEREMWFLHFADSHPVCEILSRDREQT